MNKITPKSIQMFVAGTMAYMGYSSLVRIPYYLVINKDNIFIFGSIVSSLALLVGIAMLLGSTKAFFWAQIYLWFGIIGAITMMGCLQFHVFHSTETPLSWWRATYDLLAPTIQLSLLFWNRSKYFYNEPDV